MTFIVSLDIDITLSTATCPHLRDKLFIQEVVEPHLMVVNTIQER